MQWGLLLLDQHPAFVGWWMQAVRQPAALRLLQCAAAAVPCAWLRRGRMPTSMHRMLWPAWQLSWDEGHMRSHGSAAHAVPHHKAR